MLDRLFCKGSRAVDRQEALGIAARTWAQDPEKFEILTSQDGALVLGYRTGPDPDACWIVRVPAGVGGQEGASVGPSRVMVITRENGRVLYGGPGSDEG